MGEFRRAAHGFKLICQKAGCVSKTLPAFLIYPTYLLESFPKMMFFIEEYIITDLMIFKPLILILPNLIIIIPVAGRIPPALTGDRRNCLYADSADTYRNPASSTPPRLQKLRRQIIHRDHILLSLMIPPFQAIVLINIIIRPHNIRNIILIPRLFRLIRSNKMLIPDLFRIVIPRRLMISIHQNDRRLILLAEIIDQLLKSCIRLPDQREIIIDTIGSLK